MADKDAKKEEPAEGAEGTEGAEGAAAGDGKKKSKKLFIVIGAVVFLLIAGGAGAFFAGVFDKPTAEGEHGAADGAHGATEGDGHEAAAEEEDPTKPPTYYNVPDMIVNLQSERGRPVFLKISMSLELKDELDVPAIERVLPRVIDNFQVYLRELRVDELRGSAGMYRLREELLMRVNQAVAPVKVKDVLFREMLVQ